MGEGGGIYYFATIRADHITDHLPFWRTWRVCSGERQRALFPERKGLKKAGKSGKYLVISLWDVEAGSSSLPTPTISSVHNRFELWTLDFSL